MKYILFLLCIALAYCSKSCSGGDWFRCAGTVADCWQQCENNVFTKVCMDCCGSAYDQCSQCFDDPRVNIIGSINNTIIVNNQNKFIKTNMMNEPNGCTGGDWFRCAGIVADCWQQCSDKVFTKVCMDCMGDLFDTCSKCFN